MWLQQRPSIPPDCSPFHGIINSVYQVLWTTILFPCSLTVVVTAHIGGDIGHVDISVVWINRSTLWIPSWIGPYVHEHEKYCCGQCLCIMFLAPSYLYASVYNLWLMTVEQKQDEMQVYGSPHTKWVFMYISTHLWVGISCTCMIKWDKGDRCTLNLYST